MFLLGIIPAPMPMLMSLILVALLIVVLRSGRKEKRTR